MTLPTLFFTGSSHPSLARELALKLNIPLGKIDLQFFPDKEIYVEIMEEVQGRDVIVFQSLGTDPNFFLMELFIILDALKRGGAKSLNVVIPYYSYARQDRVDKPGAPITAKLIANFLTMAGANRVITMDIHSEQIEGFFDIPIQNLLSRSVLISYLDLLKLENLVIVAPDKGGIKLASAYAKELNAPLALVEKERIDSFKVEMRLFVGDVKDKTVLIVDDICSTGGTLINAAEICKEKGAARIIAMVAHGLFLKDAIEKINRSSIELLISTNSIPSFNETVSHPKIRLVSIAPLLAHAIQHLNFN